METEEQQKKSGQPAREQPEEKNKRAAKAELKKQPEHIQKEAAEYKDVLQRLQAEFENYRKRAAKELAESKERASAETIAKILPVLDSFEIALKNTKRTEGSEQFAEGVRMIYSQLCAALEGLGLKAINAEGQRFDPYLHEALMAENVENGELDNKVLEELQKGYELKGAVIRHSKVKIGKLAENKKGKETEETKETEQTEAQNG